MCAKPTNPKLQKVADVLLLPLSQINKRFTELDPDHQYYLHCKAGVRSLKALNFRSNKD
jgi:rhodanese-related sulfurtransferase